jgi:hypothetical protein
MPGLACRNWESLATLTPAAEHGTDTFSGYSEPPEVCFGKPAWVLQGIEQLRFWNDK